MASLITEPAKSNPDTTEWINLLNKLIMTSGGFELIDFTEKNTTAVPRIKKGTRFEVNGSFFYVSSNYVDGSDPVDGFSSIGSNNWCYIYAKPSLDKLSCVFEFVVKSTANTPVFDTERGGWFHPANNWRALISCYKNSLGQCRCKSLLDRNIIYDIPTDPDYSTLGSALASTTSGNTIPTPTVIESGWYLIRMTGASGGNGAAGNSSGQSKSFYDSGYKFINGSRATGTTGENGTTPAEEIYKVWLEKGNISLVRGFYGGNGSQGSQGEDGDNVIFTPTSSTAFTGGDGADGGDGGDSSPSMLLNNGKQICLSNTGRGGKGGRGGITLNNFYSLINTNVGTWSELISAAFLRKKTPKAKGINGGLSANRGGSIYVYAM